MSFLRKSPEKHAYVIRRSKIRAWVYVDLSSWSILFFLLYFTEHPNERTIKIAFFKDMNEQQIQR